MMSGGRIVGHAAHYLGNAKNRLLIVGYQGEETLGRELMEGVKEVEIDKKIVPVRASVNTTHAMSSHADQPRLIEWLSQINGVQKLFLTHGEDVPRTGLADKLKKDMGIADITLPTLNQKVDF